MRLGILLLLCFIGFSYSRAQNVYYTGLKFVTAPFPKEKRTSLNLTPAKPVKIRNQFNFQFDLSLYDANQFGYIFRFFSEDIQLDFIYVPPKNEMAYLKLIVNKELTDIQIPIHKNKIVKNNWHKIELNIQLRKGIFSLEFDNRTYKSEVASFDRFQRMTLTFGACNVAPYIATDVPAMAIRNIRILDNEDKVIANWLLDESEGNFARNLTGGEVGQVENPIWLINDHYFWRLRESFVTAGYANFVKAKNNSKLSIIGSQKRIVYDITQESLKEEKFINANPNAKTLNRCVLNKYTSSLFSLGENLDKVAKYKLKTNSWKKLRSFSNEKPNDNSTLFSSPVSTDFFAFGGYSNYTYSNDFFRFNPKQRKWKKLQLKGDFVAPRHYTSLAASENDSCFFLFGGYGNRSGQQELGSQCLFDLYYLNAISGEVKQIWNDEENTDNYIPTDQCIVDEKEESLYALSFHPFLNSTLLRLFKVSLNAPVHTTVSDTIHFDFNESQSRARLFYNNETQEFVAAVAEKMKNDSSLVRLYTLTYPPVSEKNITESFDSVFNNTEKYPVAIYLVVLAVLLMAAWTFMWLLKRVMKSNTGVPDLLNRKEHFFVDDRKAYSKEELKKNAAAPLQNYLQLLGEFKAIDRDGNDITKLFTPKIQQLFLFILVNNIERQSGVTSKFIDQHIWPFHTSQSAKNNRSVNIRKLRNVLDLIDGISLDYTDGLWKVSFQKSSLCDLLFLLKFMSKSRAKLKYSSLEKRLSRLSKGGVALIIKEDWYEKFVASVTSQVHEFLFDMIGKIDIDSYPGVTRKISKTILKMESLNEDALKIQMLSLIKLKKHSQANNVFDSFCRDYEKLYGEVFDTSFKKFIQK